MMMNQTRSKRLYLRGVPVASAREVRYPRIALSVPSKTTSEWGLRTTHLDP
jgi:hypothetical protein